MTDDSIILASAYLDGQATEAERAQVDGDAELIAEVERLRRVRAVLADTSDASGDSITAPISTRERHLAAALDAWDRTPTGDPNRDATPAGSDPTDPADAAGAAGGASITAPVPLREQRARRRPINTRILTAAAAVIVIAGAGLVVRSALDDSSTDESFDTAAVETTPAQSPSLDELAAEEFAADSDEAADDVAEEAATPAAVDPEAVIAGGPEQAPDNNDVEVLTNNADLARFANDLIIARNASTAGSAADASIAEAEGGDDAADADTSADTGEAADVVPAATVPPTLAPPVDRCGLIDDFVGFAFWEASGIFDEPIAVGIDNGTAEAVAYQADTCTEIARTPLP